MPSRQNPPPERKQVAYPDWYTPPASPSQKGGGSPAPAVSPLHQRTGPETRSAWFALCAIAVAVAAIVMYVVLQVDGYSVVTSH